MSCYDVKVKWGKQVLDMTIDTTTSVDDFKSALYAVTGVEPGAQKIVAKGVQLKSSTPWTKLKLKSGMVLMLIGKAGPLPSAPSEKTVFLEDLPVDQQDAVAAQVPMGLVNLGNTCYLNSTVQALSSVSPLREALHGVRGGAPGQVSTQLAQLVTTLQAPGAPFTPAIFLQVFRQAFPQFAEQGEHGYAQQDAEECWTQLLQAAARDMRVDATEVPAGLPADVVHQLFGIKLDVTLRNTQAEAEPEELREEVALKLSVHISKETKYLHGSLEQSLVGEMEKNSPLLGHNCIYTKKARIARLPLFLTIQFVRFFWKQGQRGKAGNKSKITRPVDFPLTLDVLDFCSEDLKAELLPARKRLRAMESERLGVAHDDGEEKKDEGSIEVDENVAKKAKIVLSPKWDNDTGLYELHAIVTHKGRDADGGHYVAWVREDKPNSWILYDDDKVSRVNDDDIKKLTGSGGADFHMAYVCLYRAKTMKRHLDEWAAEDAAKAKQ